MIDNNLKLKGKYICVLALFFLALILDLMEISKPYKGKGKRKLKKMPFTVKGYILYYAFFWVVIISIYLAYY